MMRNARQVVRKRTGLRLAPAAMAAALLTGALTAHAGQDEDRYVVVKTKKAITITGEEIDGALIVIKGGRIEAVGKKVDYPSDSRVIDASDLIAMPGLINPRSRLGLLRVRRTGNQSHRKLSDLYYPPDDDTYRKLLESGYTLLGLYPDGHGLPGQYLVQTTFKPKEKGGVKTDGLIRMTFDRPSRDRKTLTAVLKAARAEIERQRKAASQPSTASRPADKAGKAASQPASGPATKPATAPATRPAGKPASRPAAKVSPELAPIMALLKKDKGYRALVEFSRASDVIHFEDVTDDADFPRAYVFTGFPASDLHHVIDHKLLGKADALLALSPMLPRLPLTVNPYNPAREFTAAGCRVAFFPASDTVEGHRRMRERLAFLVRAGLDRKDALKGITLHAAEWLGVEKDYGAIEKDKRGDLIFLDGDPLDPFARVRRVMINGEMVVNLERSKR
ncbi:MAG: amidohydrolase family protein [Phycisphaerae bacterium]